MSSLPALKIEIKLSTPTFLSAVTIKTQSKSSTPNYAGDMKNCISYSSCWSFYFPFQLYNFVLVKWREVGNQHMQKIQIIQYSELKVHLKYIILILVLLLYECTLMY